LQRFEQQQLERAERAARAGRLAESALAWEVLTVLQPRQETYRARLAQTRQAIDKEVAQRLARASSAQQRGDLNAAEKAWLEALSLDPRDAVAAQSLRDLERERNRASVVGRFANPPVMTARNGGGQVASMPTAPSSRGAEQNQILPGERNQVEHASMLAGQGEIDAAISLVIDQFGSSPTDLRTRQLLASLYVQRADRQSGRDNAAAIADLERALALNPKLDQARSKLQQLKRTVK
jgi:tetratricopeptide (TPR) repeat protein